MSTSLAEQERKMHPTLKLTLDRYHYRKSPIRATSLYHIIRTHLQRESGPKPVFRPCGIPSHYFVSVSEYPLALAFGIAMKTIKSVLPDHIITVSTRAKSDTVMLVMSVTCDAPEMLEEAFRLQRDTLTEIAEPSRFLSYIERAGKTVSYCLDIPFYVADSFTVYAVEEDISRIVAEAFRDVARYFS